MSEQVKHTPGPWRYDQSHPQVVEGRDNGGLWVRRALAYGHTESEVDANARLIAAAPDLLAALRDVSRQLEAYKEFAEQWFTDGVPEDWRGRCACANAELDKARAALAKAKGESE